MSIPSRARAAAGLGALVLVASTALAAPGPAAAATGPFYVSPSGRDANPGTKALPWRTIQHAANRLVAGQTVYLRGGTYRERVRPRYSGAAGRFITYAAYPGEVPTVDGAVITLPADQAGLIDIRGRAWIRVIGLRVVNARGDPNSNGILVIRSHDVVLSRNRTDNTRSSGIGVWGSRNVTVSGNDVTRACTGGFQEAISVAGTDTFLVEKNSVHAIPTKEGITLKDGSTNGRVRGNVVYGVDRVGIYVDAWDKPTSNILVWGNVIRASASGIMVASEMGGLLSDVRIVNNLVYRNIWYGIAVTRNGDKGARHPMTGVSIVNNTVWSNGATWGGGIAVDDPDAAGVVVRNNIVSANLSFQLSLSGDVSSAAVAFDHNLVDGYRGDLEDGELYGDAAVVAVPRFGDAAHGNFRLAAGSAAIDGGSGVGAPSADFAGTSRPRGAGVDIGAYEA